MTLEEALAGKEIPNEIKENLEIVTVPYFSFGGEVQEGQLVVHTEVADEVKEIFKKLLEMKFPIQQVVPIVSYNWDDDASMAANNTSAFNYRVIWRTDRLSNHSYGRAIDVNPVQNPYYWSDDIVMPPDTHYDPIKPGTITPAVVSIFKSCGWDWGGDWTKRKDYQHLEKPV